MLSRKARRRHAVIRAEEPTRRPDEHRHRFERSSGFAGYWRAPHALAHRIEKEKATESDQAAVLSIVVNDIETLSSSNVREEFRQLKKPRRRKTRFGFYTVPESGPRVSWGRPLPLPIRPSARRRSFWPRQSTVLPKAPHSQTANPNRSRSGISQNRASTLRSCRIAAPTRLPATMRIASAIAPAHHCCAGEGHQRPETWRASPRSRNSRRAATRGWSATSATDAARYAPTIRRRDRSRPPPARTRCDSPSCRCGSPSW